MGEKPREDVGGSVKRAVEQARNEERAERAEDIEREQRVDDRVVESLTGEQPETREPRPGD